MATTYFTKLQGTWKYEGKYNTCVGECYAILHWIKI